MKDDSRATLVSHLYSYITYIDMLECVDTRVRAGIEENRVGVWVWVGVLRSSVDKQVGIVQFESVLSSPDSCHLKSASGARGAHNRTIVTVSLRRVL